MKHIFFKNPYIVAYRTMLIALVCLGMVGACSQKETKLPGERISVLSFESQLQADVRLADVAVSLPPPTVNASWPQLNGSADNVMGHLAYGGELSLVWKKSVGAGSSDEKILIARPIIADDKIFTLDADLTLQAMTMAGGDLLWKRVLVEDTYDADEVFGGGLAFEDGVIFATTGLGDVMAIRANTGDILWKKNLLTPIHLPPVVSNGRVIVLTYDNRTHALSSDNGKTLWSHDVPADDTSVIAAYAPGIGGGVAVVPYSSGEILALNVINGTVVWGDVLARAGTLSSFSHMANIATSPLISGDKVYSLGRTGRGVSLDITTGTRQWTREIDATFTPWLVGNFIYLVTSEGQLLCLQKDTGRIRWLVDLSQATGEGADEEEEILWTGPVVAGGKVIVLSSSGKVFAFSYEEGKLLKSYDTNAELYIPPIVAQGKIYILTNDADILVLK